MMKRGKRERKIRCFFNKYRCSNSTIWIAL